MEHLYGLMAALTLGSTHRILNTAMEYSHGQTAVYTMANIKMTTDKAMHITGGLMAMSTMDSTVTGCSGEKESS